MQISIKPICDWHLQMNDWLALLWCGDQNILWLLIAISGGHDPPPLSPESTQDLRLLRWVITGLTCFGDRAFSVALPRAWSRLPVELRHLRSTPLFTVQSQKENVFFTHARLCIARSLPSCDVRPSVRPSHAGIVSKQLNLSWNFFHHLLAPSV